MEPVSHRWVEAALTRPAVLETTSVRIAAFAQPRQTEGRVNEDAITVVELSPSHHLLILADGVGGMPGGAQASAQAIDAIVASVHEAYREQQPLQHGVLSGFDHANQVILAAGSGATTLVVVEIDDGTLRTYHAGDSGVLVTSQRGRLKLLTMAHSPVGYAQEAGYLTESEAMHHEERHMVSNVIGCADMRIEVGQLFSLSPLDTVVVGSDGLFDNLLSHEIASIVKQGPLREVAAELAAKATARMAGDVEPGLPCKPDDLSFLLYRRRVRRQPR